MLRAARKSSPDVKNGWVTDAQKVQGQGAQEVMLRVFPGATTSLTFPVTTGGEFSAKITDPLGRYLRDITTSESEGTVTVNLSKDAFYDGASGFGRIQVKRNDAVVVNERIKFLPGLEEDYAPLSDYAFFV